MENDSSGEKKKEKDFEYGLYSSCIVHTVRINVISTAHTMWMLCYPDSSHMSKLFFVFLINFL